MLLTTCCFEIPFPAVAVAAHKNSTAVRLVYHYVCNTFNAVGRSSIASPGPLQQTAVGASNASSHLQMFPTPSAEIPQTDDCCFRRTAGAGIADGSGRYLNSSEVYRPSTVNKARLYTLRRATRPHLIHAR